MPLQLTRRVGETIEIGNNITITVMDIFNAGGQRATTRLSIVAPHEIPVHRAEVARRIEAKIPLRKKAGHDPGAYPHPPIYLLTARTGEIAPWLDCATGLDAQDLVLHRMLVVVTAPEHLRGLSGFAFYAMPGTPPALLTAAGLRPGARRLRDAQMLEQFALWQQYRTATNNQGA